MLDEQLHLLSDKDLQLIRNSINLELRSRRREASKISKYRAAIAWSSNQNDVVEKVTNPSAKKKKGIKQEPEEKYAAYKHNIATILSIPGINTHKAATLRHYLPCLLLQDWSSVYSGFDEERKYYVYAHVAPSAKSFSTADIGGGNYGGSPIYIGKGAGDRAYNLKRNQGHGKILREIINGGASKQSIVHIIQNNLSEAEAYSLESKLIYFFGTIYDGSRSHGCLFNLDIPKTPEFSGCMEELSGDLRLKHKVRLMEEIGASI